MRIRDWSTDGCSSDRHALGGTFYQPTVLLDVDAGTRIAREETFGPVAPLFRFDSEAQAIALAHDPEVGLAGDFYTRDLARGWRVAEALAVGIVRSGERRVGKGCVGPGNSRWAT